MNLVSVCAAVATLGVLTVLVAEAVPRWTGSAEQAADLTSLQLLLRETQQRALGDGRSMCVRFDPTTEGWSVLSRGCPDGGGGVTFFRDGSATPATLPVGVDTVTVDSSGHVTVS
ncbi:MAG TPA: hypothetical protein VMZ00_08355 [Sporichthya sp.]|nr:hypothetical protein [Sporichthya sp.]